MGNKYIQWDTKSKSNIIVYNSSDIGTIKKNTRKLSMPKWRCTVCGWESEEDTPEPPEECPVCGAGPEDFEPIK